MTYYIRQDTQSSFKDGIETILLLLRDPHDLHRLTLEAGRGAYAIVEWLLAELGRGSEIERVCGLSISIDSVEGAERATANLELRQPGRQMEEWLREHEAGRYQRVPGDGVVLSDSTHFNGGPVLHLSERSLSLEKFTDTHKPWWQSE